MRQGVFFRGGVTFTQVIILAILVSGSAPAPALARPTAPLVPASGALLGAWVDPGSGWSQAGVADFESRIGRTIDIDHHYYAWGDSFPGPNEVFDRDSGRIPLLTWEPWGTTLSEIAGGAYDSLIRTRARAVAAFASPVFLRLAHEMNGNWYPWDGSHNGRDPSRYVAAWRRVHDLFAAEGATNAVWVWSPNAEDVPAEPWNRFSAYYPGDSYVDWVGVDGYNFGTTETWSSWRSFETIFGPVYSAYASAKPVMIAETGSAEQGGSKAQWISDARSAIQSIFPSIAALVYFEAGARWPVTTSASALDAFRGLATDPYFSRTAGGTGGGTGGGTVDTVAPQITGLGASPQPVRSKTTVSFTLSEASLVTVVIASSAGMALRTLRADASYPAGSAGVRWDGRNDSGVRVPSGTYSISVRARDAAGNAGSATAPVRVA